MIEFEYDSKSRRKVEKQLGKMKSQTPKVLKNAINMTARRARKDIKTQTRQTYTVKASKLSQAIAMQKTASVGNLEAVISVKGKVLNLTNFKSSTPKRGAKADVRKSGLKLVEGPKKIKAWGGLNGLIWQRQTAERYPIRPLKSISAPVMVRQDDVFGKVEPTIEDNLRANVEKQVQRVLKST